VPVYEAREETADPVHAGSPSSRLRPGEHPITTYCSECDRQTDHVLRADGTAACRNHDHETPRLYDDDHDHDAEIPF
jgi:hypothetical protein